MHYTQAEPFSCSLGAVQLMASTYINIVGTLINCEIKFPLRMKYVLISMQWRTTPKHPLYSMRAVKTDLSSTCKGKPVLKELVGVYIEHNRADSLHLHV